MKYLLLLLTLAFAPSTFATKLPAEVRLSLQQSGISLDGVAIEVREVGARKPLIELNTDIPMNPASTMKLLTTYIGLDLLGPAYTWKTEAWLDGELKNGVLNGNLVLKGYGDPKFTVDQFWLWLTELRARGLREIRGDLVLDRSYFAIPPFDSGAFDNDPVRAYNVGPDALLLNFNTLHLRYMPEGNTIRLASEPPLDGIQLENQLTPQTPGSCDGWDDTINVQPNGDSILFQGGYPGTCGERDHNLSVMPHTRYLEAIFRSLWKELGGTLQGKQREGKASETALLFSTHHSEPLGNLIRDINKFSNNVMARQLFLTLGATDQASLERSTQAVSDWLKSQQLDFPELILENGAGLSRTERISAAHLAQLLQHAATHPLSAELQSSLPILGVDGSVKKRLTQSPATNHAHLKTGTLNGVKTLAGFVRSKSGKEWVIVFFINHPNARNGRVAQDAMVEWIQGR